MGLASPNVVFGFTFTMDGYLSMWPQLICLQPHMSHVIPFTNPPLLVLQS